MNTSIITINLAELNSNSFPAELNGTLRPEEWTNMVLTLQAADRQTRSNFFAFEVCACMCCMPICLCHTCLIEPMAKKQMEK
jgi:hypothetical protein